MQYYGHDEVQAAIAYTQKYYSDPSHSSEPLNVVGHSYGGTAAAQFVTGVGLPVDLLVTVDPVKKPFAGDLGKFSDNAAEWINVSASPATRDFTDSIASAGRLLGGSFPTNGADDNYSVNANHWNFRAFMETPSPNTSQAPIDAITVSYQSTGGQNLSTFNPPPPTKR